MAVRFNQYEAANPRLIKTRRTRWTVTESMFDCADGKRVILPEYGCGQQHAGRRCWRTVGV